MDNFRGKIVVADDDPDIRNILRDRLENQGFEVVLVADGRDAVLKIAKEDPVLVLLDLQMSGMSGIEVLKKADHDEIPVIIITAFGTIEKAVEAMREGAFDFITKPFSPDHLDLVVKKALDFNRIRRENLLFQKETALLSRDIIGNSPPLMEVVRIARGVSETSSTVLLLGESGTGKEVFARAIHKWSRRASRPFVVVNCVALNDELVESELFGHEKGAFTGAHQTRRGKLEYAHEGTVFLDEIGDFKPGLQAKLLRFLQEREFERVGGSRNIRVDIRIIAATNRNLEVEVREGRFRKDLFFRLNVVTIRLPPLRQRKEDIPALARYFLEEACRKLNKPLIAVSSAAMDRMMAYDWPGNLREMENLIERVAVLSDGKEITAGDVPFLSFQDSDQEAMELPYHDAVRFFQRRILRNALDLTRGNQAKASEALGLQRTYLSRLIKKLNLKIQ
ncbi:MAG TPA: sigma-54 dependent transcriptional regulator [Nitrospiria bacterium]|nr:sigma-54 dependent transcriptional regulator [Nitrospiria bacterium]